MMKKERQRKFHCTQKNNDARVSTYLWVRSPGRRVYYPDSFSTSIWSRRFCKHTGSGLLLAAGGPRSVLHSPFHDNLLVLGIGTSLPATLGSGSTVGAVKKLSTTFFNKYL